MIMEKTVVFYDNEGCPIAYMDDGEHIYLFSGETKAYISEGVVYRYDGCPIGWYEDGWVRDLDGYCVFFTDNATGCGPSIPSRHSLPSRASRYSIPPRYSVRPIRSRGPNRNSWSSKSGIGFLN